VKSLLSQVVQAFAETRQRLARQRMVEQLDEQTLRDIGLEHEANRARARSRQLYMRFGMY
jgi:hypothetical protein